MKVLFINQIDVKGGAAVAAWRISEALAEHCGTINSFIVASKHNEGKNIFNCTPAKKHHRIYDEYALKITKMLGMQYMHIPFHKSELLKLFKSLKPDIISLHNIHGDYFEISLISELSKVCPIVWTLHDMWAFTGNASYTFGDESWKEMKSFTGENNIYPQTGINNGKYLLKRKKDIYERSDLTITAPSDWLYEMALNTPVFKGKKIVKIPYAIDLQKFNPLPDVNHRDAFGIKSDEKVIFFSADWIRNEPRKGGELFLKILHELDKQLDERVTLLNTGKDNILETMNFKNFKIKNLGSVGDEDMMRNILKSSDILLHPSLADNLPNILVEASACATPAVAFDIGGTKDIVINEESGYLIEPFNHSLFAGKVKELIKDESRLQAFSLNARKHAEKHYSKKIIAEKYYKQFSEILERRKG